MEKIDKPSREDLQVLVDEIEDGGNGPINEWAEKFIPFVVKFIRKNPLQYRSYGPYWSLLKKAIVDRGFVLSDDDSFDAEVVEALSYGELPIDLIAAYAYSTGRLNEGNVYNNVHHLQHIDGSTTEYIVADDGLEALATLRRA